MKCDGAILQSRIRSERGSALLLRCSWPLFYLSAHVARRPRGRSSRQSPPLPRSRLSDPRRLTTTPRKASSKIEFTSVERSVPRREANTVNRRSFSGVKRSEHFRRSAAFPFCGFARGGFLVFGFPASWLIGSLRWLAARNLCDGDDGALIDRRGNATWGKCSRGILVFREPAFRRGSASTPA